MTEKSPEAFRTISEVADELDLPQHVLRFWETRFAQIKPLKRGGGRRYYRPEDVSLLKGIRHLLYGEGYTIKGVQKILKEQGVRFVAASAEPAPEQQRPAPAEPSRHADPPPHASPAGPTESFDEPAEPVVRSAPEAPRRPAAQTPPHASHPPSQGQGPVAGQSPAARQAPVASQTMSSEDVRQLKAALFELIECKRILDAV
ncbi:MerR family transcriptional regulator [Microbaculum marinum]|uniref:MerR family transcriptional regulator n=1 Tax=Microbaculum marinum TaxID=1764581 RepID=A0AAW9RXR0_9HYPH